MNTSIPFGRFAVVALVCGSLLTSLATADVYNDRNYTLGDDGLEDAGNAPGGVVGTGPGNVAPGLTLDSGEAGDPTGSFLDLEVAGSPVYVDVSTLGSGRTGRGIVFDGTDDRLMGIPLNRPDELASLVLPAVYPIDYTGIVGRGLQGWVYPDASAIGSAGAPTTYQSIVADTELSGGPAINEFGQWTQSNSQHPPAGQVPATVDVPAGDTWYHMMHHNYHNSGDSFTSILYIDGIAVSGNTDGIPTGGVANELNQLVIGAAEVANDGLTGAYDRYFTGAIDDLEMYVFGDNETGTPGVLSDGEDWGTFDLFADNEWIAAEIAATVPGGVLTPGDVNKDGSVNGDGTGAVGSDDVSAFIAGWRSENTLPGAHGDVAAGDWITWDDGDMNHDGVTNFLDWNILRANHPSPLSLDLGALLAAAAVPEPSSTALLLLGVASSGLLSRRRRA